MDTWAAMGAAGQKESLFQAKFDVAAPIDDTPPRGVMVLTGPADLQSATLDQLWLDFAAKNHLAVCKGLFTRNPAAISNEKTYAVASKSAEANLTQCLRRNGLQKLPFYLFGLEIGAGFVPIFTSLHPNSVAAWAALGITHAPPNSANKLPPGIVAAGDLNANYELDRRLAQSMRERGLPIAWISLPQQGHGRTIEMEGFAREFFDAILNPSGARKPVLVDNATKKAIISNDPKRLAGSSFLPSESLLASWAALHKESTVIFLTVPTGLPGYPELTMALRLPPTNPGNRPLKVLAYSPWTDNASVALANIRNDNFFWNKFAAERGMAVITWNSGHLFKIFSNSDQLNDWQAREQTQTFDAISRAWQKAFTALVKDHNLEPDGVLAYGVSAGANFCGKLAMSIPRIFSAVIMHVGNSFDKPTLNASNTVWLLTSGENDAGIYNVMRFYRQCRALHLPVLMKRFRALSHQENPQSLAFAAQFFDYYLAQDKIRKDFPAVLAAGLEKPPFLADIVNNLVFPISKTSAAPLGQCIPLPDAECAKFWGKMIER